MPSTCSTEPLYWSYAEQLACGPIFRPASRDKSGNARSGNANPASSSEAIIKSPTTKIPQDRLPTASRPSFVSSRLGHQQNHKDWAWTSQTILRSLKTPGSLQINLLFTMYAEQASVQTDDANFYFFKRQLPRKTSPKPARLNTNRFGGAERDRTADPLLAKQVLSQLSYSPSSSIAKGSLQRLGNLPRQYHLRYHHPSVHHSHKRMVGPGRLELPTPRLSSVCSNQLSYGPISVNRSTRFFVFMKKEKRGRRSSPYRACKHVYGVLRFDLT